VVGVMIVGAVLGLSQWEHMHSVPPPSAKLKPQYDVNRPTMVPAPHPTPIGAPEESKTASAGGGAPAPEKPKTDATLTILEGAASQGNPDYDPDELKVKKGNTILVENKDMMPHTVTNGKGASDATSGKLFDTSIINGGEFKVIETANVDAGSHPFYCTVHPYMTGTLVVE
jgi:plastocyanin